MISACNAPRVRRERRREKTIERKREHIVRAAYASWLSKFNSFNMDRVFSRDNLSSGIIRGQTIGFKRHREPARYEKIRVENNQSMRRREGTLRVSSSTILWRHFLRVADARQGFRTDGYDVANWARERPEHDSIATEHGSLGPRIVCAKQRCSPLKSKADKVLARDRKCLISLPRIIEIELTTRLEGAVHDLRIAVRCSCPRRNE